MIYRLFVVLFFSILSCSTQAQVNGRVLEAGTGTPIVNAKVRVQADPASVEVSTNSLGEFSLPVTPTGLIGVAAFRSYDHGMGAVNYASKVEEVTMPINNLVIFLDRIPPHQLAGYTPLTGQSCGGCHTRQRADWQSARHSQSAINPWVLDLFSGTGTPGGAAGYVYKNTHDVGSSGFCATCHAPMQDVFTPGMLQLDNVSTASGADGVNCVACHQIANVDQARINNLHAAGTFGKTDYYFANDANAAFQVFGALKDVNTDVMRNIYNPLFSDSKLCASCHQYANPTTGTIGQNTYMEWLASSYAQPGAGFKSCQNCHMPEETSAGTIASGGVTRPGSQRHRHTFVGATPTTLVGAIRLQAQQQVQAGELVVNVDVSNIGAGHAFPTGISIRNALLIVRAKRVGGSDLVQVAGPTIPIWADDDLPGVTAGDLSGLPGRGFAKVLSGRINGQGAVQSPVLFIDAESSVDTSIAAGATDSSSYRFTIPAGVSVDQLEVEASLIYRRAFRALAVTKGWTQTPSGGPIETEVARVQITESIYKNGFE